MGRLTMLLGRRRRERTPTAAEPAEMVTGFPSRRPSAWGDEHEVGEAELDRPGLRRRHGRGTNYLVVDQPGATGSSQL